jgi:RNA polymerase sigma-32 factor
MTSSQLLSRDEERRLMAEYQRTRAPQLEERLVRSQQGLVWQLARSHRVTGVDLEDVVQEGMLGLLEAIRRFDPAVETRLSTYAAWWIRAYQYRYLMRNHRLVRIGTTQAQRRLFFRLHGLQARLEAAGLEPTAERIAAILRVDVEEVREVQPRLAAREVALDAPARAGDRDTRVAELAAHTLPADDGVQAREESDILRGEVVALRRGLDGRRRRLFDARWLGDEQPTLCDMGREFGVTRERARQLEQGILSDLRTRVAACVSSGVGSKRPACTRAIRRRMRSLPPGQSVVTMRWSPSPAAKASYGSCSLPA